MTIRIPPVLKPVKVEVALGTMLVQIGHIAIAVSILPNRNVQNIAYATTP